MAAAVPVLPAEEVPLDRECTGRVLAEPVHARVLLPPFDNSAMDGYAVMAQDLIQVPVRLPVVGEMAAGSPPGSVSIESGTCAKVMTGGPLPDGADSVVPYEWTDRGAAEVLIRQRPDLGNAVRRAGEDLRPGVEVFGRGHRLRPTDLAPLAATGLEAVLVGQRPKVALVTTGDEIRPPGTKLGPGQIYDTAGAALGAQIGAAGGLLVQRRWVGDDPEAVREVLGRAAAEADLLVTVGGVSVGDHDHVRETVERLGRLHLWRVAMRPGRPVSFGSLGNCAFLGLPGNPVSAAVTFILFGVPCLLQMQGARRIAPPTLLAELLEDIDKPEGLETFHRAVLQARRGQLPGVRLAGNQSSGATISLALADGIMALPAAGDHLGAGATVEVIPLG